MIITTDNLWFISKYIKRYEPSDLDNKKEFKRKCFEKNISYYFLAYCQDHLNEDYDDIIDELLIEYNQKLINVKNNKELKSIYNTYIKVLNNIKNYIKKELC